ncbi:MAG: DUF4199 domain-containing protein [Bacteroidetes bacterium]|jgi:hypothetical protein|nr:DUF4199 domain-containing protein [Bacteroidota bacterium]
MEERNRYYSSKQFWMVATAFGFFTGLIVFVVYFLLTLLFKNTVSIIYSLVYLLPFAGMYWAVIRLRDYYGRTVIRFSQAFLCSWITAIIAAAVFASVLYIVYSEMNAADLKYKALAIEQQLMAKSGTMTLNQVKELRQQLSTLLSPAYLAQINFVFYSGIGLIYALIIAIFVKRKDRFIEA